jgi:putative NADPH-quinone reductase
MPAILKGFFDRMFVPGTAFNPDPNGGRLIPLLQNIHTLVVVTTMGAPWWITELYAEPGPPPDQEGHRRCLQQDRPVPDALNV